MRIIERPRQRGQALVEFSLAIVIFLVLLMGIFDAGRAIFMYNGVSEAAREIARRAAVHPYLGLASGATLGSSLEAQATIATQRQLVPGMAPVVPGAPNFECVDIAGNASINATCGSGDAKDYVRVTVSASFQPALLGLLGPVTLSSTSSVAVP